VAVEMEKPEIIRNLELAKSKFDHDCDMARAINISIQLVKEADNGRLSERA
jgi:hypothetical protein